MAKPTGRRPACLLTSQQVEAVSTQIEAELGEVVPEVTQVFLDPTPRELYRTKATVRTS